MKSFIVFAFLMCSAFGHAQQRAQELPKWIQTKIAGYQGLPPFSPPRFILRARYEGKDVYYVSPACCDIPSELYDEGGNLLCYPDGGFAGGDGKCRSFATIGNVLSTVWRDARTPR